MRKFWSAATAVVGMLGSASALAIGLSFQDPPPEQSLVHPGDKPVVSAQPAVQARPQVMQQQQQPEPEISEAFYVKPTYVTQSVYNVFKRQVAQILKDLQQRQGDTTQQALDAKIKQQSLDKQILGIKQMLGQMTTLIAKQAQAQQEAGTGPVWKQSWFMLLSAIDVILLLMVLLLWLNQRKRNRWQQFGSPASDNGGDYDYMSSADSAPSHINLAQTYLAMGDYARARKALEFVVMKDNGTLKQQATELLKQFPKD